MSRLTAAISVMGCCALALGCASGGTTSDGARLELVVTPGRIELARGEPIALVDVDPEIPPDAALTWQFLDGDGIALAGGAVADPRIVQYEALDESDEHDGVIRAGAGSITVTVPDVEGTLQISDGDGTIGEMHYMPLHGQSFGMEGPGGKGDIDFDTDLIGKLKTVSGNGDAHRINMLVVPEGYTLGELDQFHSDADRMLGVLSGVVGYHEHWDDLNIWMQDIKSAESGISDPNTGNAKNTAFNISYGDDKTAPRRCLMPGTSWAAKSVANLHRLAEQANADVVIILANVGEYSGCAHLGGDRFVVASNSPDIGRVLAHELGHALFHLADEYVETGHTCITDAPNVSSQLDALPWVDLIEAGTALPTPSGTPGVGAFEGAGYCAHGSYRPADSCTMRLIGSDFCPVCRREVDRAFERRKTASPKLAIKNSTGQPIFVMCDGYSGSPTCAGWTIIQSGATISIAVTSASFMIDNTTISHAKVHWSNKLLNAPSAQFTIYANAIDPFSPPP